MNENQRSSDHDTEPQQVPWTRSTCGRAAYPGWVIAERTSPILWHVECDDCAGDSGSEFYSFSTDQAATWPALVRWCAHLSEKQWLPESNWADVLYHLDRPRVDTPETR